MQSLKYPGKKKKSKIPLDANKVMDINQSVLEISKVFEDILVDKYDVPSDKAAIIAKKVHGQVYIYSNKLLDVYINNFSHIIDNTKNKTFMKKLISNPDIDIFDRNNFLSKENMKLYKQMQYKIEHDKKYENTLNVLVSCKKCLSRAISFGSGQTRSADEGATYSYKCLTCGNTWKN